jgi:hypothetical protein
MLSSDIKISDNASRGVQSLRDFLKFLEQNHLQENRKEKEHKFSSIFAKNLYAILREKGYHVVPKVGISGYHIDLAVISKKDGAYILAIECDGEKFYSANSSSDRYRLKVEALKRLGWNHYQIWSAEWHKNRTLELQRLMDAIDYFEEHREEKKEPIIEEEVPKKKIVEPSKTKESSTIPLLEQLQHSSFEQIIQGLNSIQENLSNSILPIVLGIAKVHPEAKIRKKALVVLKEQGGEKAKQLLKICEKKRYLSMSNEQRLKIELNKMDKIKDFNVDAFAKYIAKHHPLALGNHRFIEEESDEVEQFILERLNKEKVTLITAVNSKFLNATNIRELSVTSMSQSLWKMHWLERLRLDYVGSHISIPNALNRLTKLHSLSIYAKHIHIESTFSPSIKFLAIQACSTLTFQENIVLDSIETLYLISINEDYKINFQKLQQVLPSVQHIKIGSYTKFNLGREKNALLEAFPKVRFSYDR